MSVPKTCILCQHFHFDGGEPDYSEETPGTDWKCLCIKSHFHLDGYSACDDDFRDELLRAETCADFQLSDYLDRLARDVQAGKWKRPES